MTGDPNEKKEIRRDPGKDPAISDPTVPGRPRDPQVPPMTPDGDPQRRDEPANEPINPEPEQPPEPVPDTAPE